MYSTLPLKSKRVSFTRVPLLFPGSYAYMSRSLWFTHVDQPFVSTIRNYLQLDPIIQPHHPSTTRLDPSQHAAWIHLTNTRTDYNSSAHGSRSDLRFRNQQSFQSAAPVRSTSTTAQTSTTHLQHQHDTLPII